MPCKETKNNNSELKKIAEYNASKLALIKSELKKLERTNQLFYKKLNNKK